MKQINKDQFLELLKYREAVNKDLNLFNNILMQAQLQITANQAANSVNLLQATLDELTRELLTYVNLSDKVNEETVTTIFKNNLLNLNKEYKNDSN